MELIYRGHTYKVPALTQLAWIPQIDSRLNLLIGVIHIPLLPLLRWFLKQWKQAENGDFNLPGYDVRSSVASIQTVSNAPCDQLALSNSGGGLNAKQLTQSENSHFFSILQSHSASWC